MTEVRFECILFYFLVDVTYSIGICSCVDDDSRGNPTTGYLLRVIIENLY